MPVRMLMEELCPNCGEEIDDERLMRGGVCRNCLLTMPREPTISEIAEHLKKLKKLKHYAPLTRLEKNVEKFRAEFTKAVGHPPWALQEVWARRVMLDENFAIVAPTGVGKTIFCLMAALFLVKHRRRRCYLMLPSAIMVEQMAERAAQFAERLEISGERIVSYHGGMSKQEKDEALRKITERNYSLLITTDRFLVDRMDALEGTVFDNIFVDDVDSFLKSPKNIDRVVSLLGFDPNIIETVLRLVEVRRRLSSQGGSELRREYEELERELRRAKKRKHGRLVVTGATLKARVTKRVLVFSELLDFELGTKPEFVRNIVDFYLRAGEDLVEEAVELVRRHGGGALVFVPVALGRPFAKKVAEALEEAGLKPYFYEKMEENILEKFVAGEYDVLVGVASGRSPLARGIDLPERVRYAVFVGVPRREIRIERREANPNKLYAFMTNVLDILEEPAKMEALKILQRLGKIVPVTGELAARVKEALEEGVKLEGYAGYIQQTVEQAQKLMEKILTPQFVERLARETDISVKVLDDAFSLILPDTSGYLQASGRTSRLYAAGVSRGVSIVLVDDEKTFAGLTRRLRAILEDFQWTEYGVEDALKAFEEVDRDRRTIAEIRAGRLFLPVKDLIKMALMIVESPTKAKTFARFFGKPYRRRINGVTVYETSTGGLILQIAATMGHLTDLSTEPGIYGVIEEDGRYVPVFTPIKRCNKCGYQFVDEEKCPSCGSADISSKLEIIEVLRKIAMEVNEVYVATDPDAEGEKIAYDISAALKPYNKNISRLEFHEVTRKALLNALANKRSISIPLVEAQLVRRIEDRWLGFELSRKLWERFKSKTLSAGRVQTPVLGWIVARADEARKKKTLLRILLENGVEVVYENPPDPESILKRAGEGALKARVKNLREEVRKVPPPPPYTTDSLLRDAFTYLGLPVTETMRLAQELFESGLITYHRTDATTVSSVGLSIAREYIESRVPGEFVPRTYRKEGAHECIRPVKPIDSQRLGQYIRVGLIKPTAKLTSRHLKLYDLIFRRFIASQLPVARVSVQRYVVEVNGLEVDVERNVKILDPGFNKVFTVIRVGRRVEEGEYGVKEAETRRVPAAWLYTEGDVIALMKERGIGRPSTYSKIVQVLFERGYVFEKRGKLIPTGKGRKVYIYLRDNFGEHVSEEVTRELEETMDKVEAGVLNYQEVLARLGRQLQEISAVKVAA